MTKQEALNKIRELENYIKELNNKIGFEDDKIFLLSIEEYKRYRKKIPSIRTFWWLRSPSTYDNYAAYVRRKPDETIDNFGYNVSYDCIGIRPALKYSNLESEIIDFEEIDYFIWNGVKWKIIDKERRIAIAYMPINFDKFDNVSNNYENSYIRKWLLDWSKM